MAFLDFVIRAIPSAPSEVLVSIRRVWGSEEKVAIELAKAPALTDPQLRRELANWPKAAVRTEFASRSDLTKEEVALLFFDASATVVAELVKDQVAHSALPAPPLPQHYLTQLTTEYRPAVIAAAVAVPPSMLTLADSATISRLIGWGAVALSSSASTPPDRVKKAFLALLARKDTAVLDAARVEFSDILLQLGRSQKQGIFASTLVADLFTSSNRGAYASSRANFGIDILLQTSPTVKGMALNSVAKALESQPSKEFADTLFLRNAEVLPATTTVGPYFKLPGALSLALSGARPTSMEEMVAFPHALCYKAEFLAGYWDTELASTGVCMPSDYVEHLPILLHALPHALRLASPDAALAAFEWSMRMPGAGTGDFPLLSFCAAAEPILASPDPEPALARMRAALPPGLRLPSIRFKHEAAAHVPLSCLGTLRSPSSPYSPHAALALVRTALLLIDEGYSPSAVTSAMQATISSSGDAPISMLPSLAREILGPPKLAPAPPTRSFGF